MLYSKQWIIFQHKLEYLFKHFKLAKFIMVNRVIRLVKWYSWAVVLKYLSGGKKSNVLSITRGNMPLLFNLVLHKTMHKLESRNNIVWGPHLCNWHITPVARYQPAWAEIFDVLQIDWRHKELQLMGTNCIFEIITMPWICLEIFSWKTLILWSVTQLKLTFTSFFIGQVVWGTQCWITVPSVHAMRALEKITRDIFRPQYERGK